MHPKPLQLLLAPAGVSNCTGLVGSLGWLSVMITLGARGPLSSPKFPGATALKKQSGFTLIEMTVVMAILALVAMLSTPALMDELNRKRSDASIQETQMILDAARAYRIDTGIWPGGSTCANALQTLKTAATPYLANISTINRYSSPYSTSCTAKSFSIDQNAVADWDGYIANTLAATEIVDAGSSRLRSTIGIPGSEPALDGKLSRLATGNAELNRMRTTLFMGGNSLTEADQIQANSGQFSGNVSAGSANVAGNLQAGSANITNGLSAGNGWFNGSLGVNGRLEVGTKGAGVSGLLESLGLAVYGNARATSLTVDQMALFYSTLNAQGESQFGGRATFNDVVVLNKVAYQGQGCQSGALAREPSGKFLYCENGVFRPAGGNPDFVAINISGYSANDVSVYQCPGGYTKIGWDTTGKGWRGASNGSNIIGENDYATVFCAKF